MWEKNQIKLLIIYLLLIKSAVICENEQKYMRLIADIFDIPVPSNSNGTISTESQQKTIDFNDRTTSGPIELTKQQSPMIPRIQDETLLNQNGTKVSNNNGQEYNNDTKNFCGLDKICVQSYQCTNGTVNTDGDGIFDARFAVEYPKCGLFEMCCELDSIDTQAIDTQAIDTQAIDTQATDTQVIDTQEQPTIAQSCDEGSECVPVYQCIDGVINFDGDSLLEERISDDDGDVNQNLDNKSKCPISSEICCLVENKTRHMHAVGCGYRNVNGITNNNNNDNSAMNPQMNINDNEARFGEFPWMVAVLKEIIESGIIRNLYQCGGSLITPSVILTAAHSVNNKSVDELIVRAGEWNTKTISSDFPYQERSISEIIIHENFHTRKLRNDIAIIIINDPFIIDHHVNTICLPPFMPNIGNSNRNRINQIVDSKNCIVTGWGKQSFESNAIFVNILKKVTLPIVGSDECQRQLRNTRLGKHFKLHTSFICAGGGFSAGEGGQDACTGDGGSPLVCPIIGGETTVANTTVTAVYRYYQFGIVSWGIGCFNNIPGAYANVPLYKEWIDRKLSYKNISSDEYTFRP